MMKKDVLVSPNFIIAGTNKAATSSVFTYLSAHPEVCGSSIKETGFFAKEYTGNPATDLACYLKYFEHCKLDVSVVMEASPGYLAWGKIIACRIKAMLPDVKLLFILRSPVERLYSYYNFHIGVLTKDFDTNISFEEYVEWCMPYSSNRKESTEFNMDERHLRALKIGRYAEYLKEYYLIFPRKQIKVMFYEHLKDDLRGFMAQLCDFLKIDARFYDRYKFDRINVTSSARMNILHSIALTVNKRLEKYLRQRPKIKRKIVTVYKYLNQKNEGYPPIPDAVRLRLENYYAPSNKELAELLLIDECASWVG